MLSNLFITVAYFRCENFPLPTSKSGEGQEKGLHSNSVRFLAQNQVKSKTNNKKMVKYFSSTGHPITQIALWPTTKCSYGPQVKNQCFKIITSAQWLRTNSKFKRQGCKEIYRTCRTETGVDCPI